MKKLGQNRGKKMYDKNVILGFETDTVWGIGCHPLKRENVLKIYDIKGREKTKPLILMSSKFEYLTPYIKIIPDYAKDLIKNFFPGGLTLIFEKTDFCPDFLTSGFNTIGVRLPNHKGFYDLAENFEGHVLATTSLNISNEPPVKNYEEAYQKFGDKIEIIKPLNNTPPAGLASTVVLCTGEAPVVLRQGSVKI